MASTSTAHQYSKAIYPMIETIGAPLLKAFGITHFGLIKFNDQRLMLRIANHEKWNQIYLQEKFYNDLDLYNMSSIPINGVHRKLLTDQPTTKHQKILYDNDLWNFLLLYERTEHQGSFFFFGTTRENKQIIDSYLNYQNVFDHFVFYFKQKMANLLEINRNTCIELDINPLEHFPKPEKTEEKIQAFYDETKITKFHLGETFRNASLSKRETECLFHLVQGKTTKEIAGCLGLSPRTIESFINKLKIKTDITRKSELAQKLYSVAHLLNHSVDSYSHNKEEKN